MLYRRRIQPQAYLWKRLSRNRRVSSRHNVKETVRPHVTRYNQQGIANFLLNETDGSAILIVLIVEKGKFHAYTTFTEENGKTRFVQMQISPYGVDHRKSRDGAAETIHLQVTSMPTTIGYPSRPWCMPLWRQPPLDSGCYDRIDTFKRCALNAICCPASDSTLQSSIELDMSTIMLLLPLACAN